MSQEKLLGVTAEVPAKETITNEDEYQRTDSDASQMFTMRLEGGGILAGAGDKQKGSTLTAMNKYLLNKVQMENPESGANMIDPNSVSKEQIAQLQNQLMKKNLNLAQEDHWYLEIQKLKE